FAYHARLAGKPSPISIWRRVFVAHISRVTFLRVDCRTLLWKKDDPKCSANRSSAYSLAGIVTRAEKRWVMSRTEPSGISLTEAEAAIAKGMISRGDRQHDIAAWFGVNGGRIGDISTGRK